MPRRSRPRQPTAAAAAAASPAPPTRDQVESGADGDWIVRSLTGAANTKPYRCPGCDHQIRLGTPHLVVWPADDADADERRHWHRACWRSRGRRNPGRRRW